MSESPADRRNAPASAQFEIDFQAGCLRRQGAPVQLRPKTWKLLVYLAERPGELVTKSEILNDVWDGRAVAEEVISVSVRELRRALGEPMGGQQSIQTVHGRGYRFLASTMAATNSEGAGVSTEPFVSRQKELAILQRAWQATREGQRQLVVVNGEAGIGKTAAIQQFLRLLKSSHRDLVAATGQCVEEFRGEEPFYPVVEILAQLGRSAIGSTVLSALRRYARAWLLQLPSIISEEEQSNLLQTLTGETRDHRTHNLIEAIDSITEQRPVVLVFEDVHWSDSATVELIYRLATRPIPAKLLILCTRRPEVSGTRGQAFSRIASELATSRRCVNIDIPPLTANEIDAYIHLRYDGASVSAPLRQWFHRQTDGNPLFMVNVADELVHRNIAQPSGSGWIVDANSTGFDDIPESLRSIIEHRCSHLSRKERLVLEAASVAGLRFADEAIQNVVGESINAAEQLASLARRRQMIVRLKDERWPDGSAITTYSFKHTLYREVLVSSIPARRRADWHRSIGLRMESAFACEPILVGADLVEHFDQGLDPLRSGTYLAMLGANALQRFEYAEGVSYFASALTRIQDLPDLYDLRLFLMKARGSASLGLTGYGTEASGTYLREVQELVARGGTNLDHGWVVGQFSGWHALRADHRNSVPLAEELILLADDARSDQFYLWGNFLAAVGHAWAGNLQRSIDHYHAGNERLDAMLQRRTQPNIPPEAKTLGMCGCALATCVSSDPTAALAVIEAASEYNREQVRQDFGTMLTSWLTAVFHALMENYHEAGVVAREVIDGAERRGLPAFDNLGRIIDGWARVMEGKSTSLEEIERAWRAHRSFSGIAPTICLLLLAQAYAKVHRIDAAIAAIQEALSIAQRDEENLLVPELLRHLAKYHLESRRSDPQKVRLAQHSLEEAITFARRREMNFWKIRIEESIRELQERLATAGAA